MSKFRKPANLNAAQSAFEAMLNASLSTPSAALRTGFDPGESVEATVITTRGSYVVLDVQAKNEGLVPVSAFTDEEGKLLAAPGDKVTVTFVAMQNGSFLFTNKSTAVSVDQTIQEAASSGLPIEGKVTAEVNGGYEVMIGQNRAFCPYSQISLFRAEGAVYVGESFPFVVQEYNPEERNIVVSRRAVLQRERDAQLEQLKAELVEGATRKGRVTRIVDFGFFVDLGGAEGLVPLKEISWQRNVKPADIVHEGDVVEVLVRSVDWERNRISLSLRATQTDPFDLVADKYEIGATAHVKITHLENFGAFAELEPGCEGLIPIGALGNGRHINRPSEVVSEGQELDVRVESIDRERRRISLRPIDPRIDGLRPVSLAAGTTLEGIVEGVKPFGVFIRLSEKDTGLLSAAELGIPKGPSGIAKMEAEYPADKQVTVVIKENDGRRISLTTPDRWNPNEAAEAAKAIDDFRKANDSSSLGSLASAFDKLNLNL